MRILIKTFSIALAVTIPITSFCLGANIVTRMPDVYQYEFKATDVLKNFDLNKNDDQMGEFISDFMTGKIAKLQIIKEDDDRPQSVFTKNEMLAAANARKYMNILAAIGIMALIFMVVSFIMLKKYEFDKEIRRQFKLGAIIYGCLIVAYVAGYFIAAKTGHSLGDLLGYIPHEDDLLPQIITDGLKRRLFYSTAVVSTIIMGILGYIIYKITEPKRIFSRNYY
ncbi:DUF1461 domain-containing protein [Aminipila terrae]|uniref:DUF1461 domain-containing protein n=1 Tax=Aminipila terrae TaxID=2697030 RepID=A0A6P1MD17_9FIRM|nr:DUF1461 domain-containing protein [Aminipila terrae]QHI71912.1 DUF1461 domain-containing protein [Aminipila terrae]